MIQPKVYNSTGQLKITGVSKSFGAVKALCDVDFTLRPGTVHAVVGENGAGKSTLMKILAGVHRPDAGTIHYGQMQLNLTSPAQAIEAGISMIYQELDLAEHLTVAENVFSVMNQRVNCRCRSVTKSSSEIQKNWHSVTDFVLIRQPGSKT